MLTSGGSQGDRAPYYICRSHHFRIVLITTCRRSDRLIPISSLSQQSIALSSMLQTMYYPIS